MSDDKKTASLGRALLCCAVVILLGQGLLLLRQSGVFHGAGNVLNPGEMVVRGHVASVPRDCFILVRTDAGYGAFKLTEETNLGDGGMKYVWYFRTNADGSFSDLDAQQGESVVFEKYDRTRLSSREELVKDMGGRLWIECGPIRLEWSSGDHIYFPPDRPAEIACTSESDITAVSVTDPALIWCGRASHDGSNVTQGLTSSRKDAEKTEETP